MPPNEPSADARPSRTALFDALSPSCTGYLETAGQEDAHRVSRRDDTRAPLKCECSGWARQEGRIPLYAIAEETQ